MSIYCENANIFDNFQCVIGLPFLTYVSPVMCYDMRKEYIVRKVYPYEKKLINDIILLGI